MSATRLLVIDKTAVLENVRRRWGRLAEMPGIDLTLLVPDRWEENYQLIEYRRPAGVAGRDFVGRVVFPGKEQRGFYLTGLSRALRETRPQVILMVEEAFSLFALQTTFLRRLFAPRSRLVFYSNVITPWESLAYKLRPLYLQVARFVLRRADHALCVSQLAVAELHKFWPSISSEAIFYGVDEELFQPKDRHTLRGDCGIDENEFVVLYAGRFRTQKGVGDLIRAFGPLAESFTGGSRLVLIGSGEAEGDLQDLVETLGMRDRVLFLPMQPIEVIADWMALADVLVLPSQADLHEQFGRVLVEAMLCGTPAIGSTSGSIPEVIGDGGWVYPAGDVEALAERLLDVARDPDERRKRGRAGRAAALERHSVRAFVERAAGLVRDLTDRGEAG